MIRRQWPQVIELKSAGRVSATVLRSRTHLPQNVEVLRSVITPCFFSSGMGLLD